ncbi:MAG: hypothetical protein GY822_17020 [Deltaproteobacteria bacterium]|nr:hypothetical protein [Deltaproteobacteria bacterium]
MSGSPNSNHSVCVYDYAEKHNERGETCRVETQERRGKNKQGERLTLEGLYDPPNPFEKVDFMDLGSIYKGDLSKKEKTLIDDAENTTSLTLYYSTLPAPADKKRFREIFKRFPPRIPAPLAIFQAHHALDAERSIQALTRGEFIESSPELPLALLC